MYWSIEDKKTAFGHGNIKWITYILSLILVWLLDDKYILDYITT